jgi:uncharacterized protein (TIGR04255 family)
MKIPKRLKRNPIIDAVAEVRFTSSLPSEAIIGLVYENVKEKFGQPKSLPILQLPAALREKDPNLRYQACYRFDKPGNVLLVGPHNIALSTVPYTDWAGATPLLSELLTKVDQIKLFQSVDRIGLRYVNFFERLNIFEHITLSIEINKQSIAARTIVLRTEAEVDGFKVITNVTNTAESSTAGEKKDGSLLDIDIVKERPELRGASLPSELLRLFTEANQLADDAFFGLVKEPLFARFEPEY